MQEHATTIPANYSNSELDVDSRAAPVQRLHFPVKARGWHPSPVAKSNRGVRSSELLARRGTPARYARQDST
jgi:hypothetical protein